MESLGEKFVSLPPKDQLTIVLTSLALLISFSGFFLSVTTFYISVLKRPRLRILTGDVFGIIYEQGQNAQNQTSKSETEKLHVTLYMDVILLNEGARHGALLDLTGTLTKLDKQSSQLAADASTGFKWFAFVESKNISTAHDHIQEKKEFAGMVMPLDIPGHESVTKEIKFSCEPTRFTEGRYKLGITGRAYPKSRWAFGKTLIGQTRYFNLGPGEIRSLEAMRKLEGGIGELTEVEFDRI